MNLNTFASTKSADLFVEFRLENGVSLNTFGETLGAVCEDAVEDGQDVRERVDRRLRLAAFKSAKKVSAKC